MITGRKCWGRLLSGGGLVFLMAGATAAQQRAATPEPLHSSAETPLVLDRVVVVDVERGLLIPNQRVVVAGHRIQAMGAARAVRLPTGARVVEARGKYLMPGLWDMHAHVLPEGPDAYLPYAAYVLAGVTGIREMATPQLSSVLRWRREFAAGTKLGPRVLTSGSSVGYRDTAGWAGNTFQIRLNTPEEGRRVVDSLHKAGADFLKIYPSWGGPPMPREVYLAMLAEARRIGFHVAGHPPLTVPALEAVDSGQRSFEHMAYELGTGTTTYDSLPPKRYEGFFAPCWRADSVGDRQCAAFAQSFVRHNSFFTPTLSVWAGDASDRAKDAYGKFNRGDFWLLTRLERFGLPLLAGSDQPIWGLDTTGVFQAAQAIHEELALLVTAGLTPLAALRTATLNPAKYWNATDSLGTVAPGKLADLLVLDADPLGDIHNTKKVYAVVVNGRYLDRPALDSAKTDLARRLELARQAQTAQRGKQP